MTPRTKPIFSINDWNSFLQAMLKSIEIPVEIPRLSCCAAILIGKDKIKNEAFKRVVKRFIEHRLDAQKFSQIIMLLMNILVLKLKRSMEIIWKCFCGFRETERFLVIKTIKKDPLNIKTNIDFKTFIYKNKQK